MMADIKVSRRVMSSATVGLDTIYISALPAIVMPKCSSQKYITGMGVTIRCGGEESSPSTQWHGYIFEEFHAIAESLKYNKTGKIHNREVNLRTYPKKYYFAQWDTC